MKKIFLSIILALGCPVIAAAHPPTEVRLTYQAAEKNLHVEVIHTVTKHTRHYIRKITISNNNKEIHSQYFQQQVDPAKFVQDFKIEAKPGDVLVVEAFSSQGGSLAASVTVPEEAANAADSKAGSPPETKPAYSGKKAKDSHYYTP